MAEDSLTPLAPACGRRVSWCLMLSTCRDGPSTEADSLGMGLPAMGQRDPCWQTVAHSTIQHENWQAEWVVHRGHGC